MKFLAKNGWLLLLLICCGKAFSQSQVEIHQVNVGNGDGALIKVIDGGTLVYTIVIDGGLPSTSNSFVPYLKQALPDMPGHAGKKKIDWVILSHNHQDHFNGLIQMFKDPAFIISNITDQGVYSITTGKYPTPLVTPTNSNTAPYITPAKGKTTPQTALIGYANAVKIASDRSKIITTADIKPIDGFVNSTKTFQDIPIPATVGGTPLTMVCIAANAFTRTITGTTARDIGNLNPNNFSYGWVLEFGKFRFYSGGDLGGYSGSYTDQEDGMGTYLTARYPSNHPLDGTNTGKNFPGHVCVAKADHHGSTNSSNPEFLEALAYSAIVTSAGKHSRWKIPTEEFVDRVADNPAFGAKQGIYFTQLYNYGTDNALKEANTKFKGKAAYDYIEPTAAKTGQYSYIFVIKKSTTYPTPPSGSKTVDITAESTFEVFKVRSSDYATTSQYFFKCHQP